MASNSVLSAEFLGKALGNNQATGLTAMRSLPPSEVKLKWRDILTLEISDPVLKRHTEGFLDKLEKSAFRFQLADSSGKLVNRELSGQEILLRLKELQVEYTDPQKAKFFNDAVATLKKAGVLDGHDGVLKDGKLIIQSHDKPYVSAATGSNTLQTEYRNEIFPLRINLGTEYLRGAQVKGHDGKYSAVTVDGVLANELGHMAFRSRSDRLSDDVENIIVNAMGGKPRVYSEDSGIKFQKGSNFSYHTLYDKVDKPAAKPSVKTSGASPNVGKPVFM